MSKFGYHKWIKTSNQKIKSINDDDHEKVESLISQIELSQRDITGDYDSWFRVGVALVEGFGESGRDFYHRISVFHPDYSRNQCDDQYDKCINSNGSGITLGTLFYIAREKGIQPQKELKSSQSVVAYDTTNNEIETEFLQRSNTEIIDVLSREFAFIPEQQIVFKRDMFGEIDYNQHWKYSDLFFYMKDKKLKITKDHFTYMLSSKSIHNITPLHVFYNEIRNVVWNGEDHIASLFNCANIMGNSDKNLELFRKWITTVYSFALRGIDPELPKKSFSRVVLVLFSHERGLGKTEFFRKLGLSNYFEDLTQIEGFEVYSEVEGHLGSDERRIQLMLANSLILNIDDIQDMLINSSGELRSIVSKEKITSRTLYTENLKHTNRRAGICGSTNHGEILRSDDENRYLVFELGGVMDFEGINNIDFLQLWSQARAMYLNNKEASRFCQSDLALIAEQSKKFTYTSIEEQAVSDCFEYDPDPIEEWKYNDIEAYLKGHNYTFTSSKLGSALKKLAPGGKIIKKKNNGKDRLYLIRCRKSEVAQPNSKLM